MARARNDHPGVRHRSRTSVAGMVEHSSVADERRRAAAVEVHRVGHTQARDEAGGDRQRHAAPAARDCTPDRHERDPPVLVPTEQGARVAAVDEGVVLPDRLEVAVAQQDVVGAEAVPRRGIRGEMQRGLAARAEAGLQLLQLRHEPARRAEHDLARRDRAAGSVRSLQAQMDVPAQIQRGWTQDECELHRGAARRCRAEAPVVQHRRRRARIVHGDRHGRGAGRDVTPPPHGAGRDPAVGPEGQLILARVR